MKYPKVLKSFNKIFKSMTITDCNYKGIIKSDK